MAGGIALLRIMGKRVPVHQARISDVCDSRGGCGSPDSICGMPVHVGGHIDIINRKWDEQKTVDSKAQLLEQGVSA